MPSVNGEGLTPQVPPSRRPLRSLTPIPSASQTPTAAQEQENWGPEGTRLLSCGPQSPRTSAGADPGLPCRQGPKSWFLYRDADLGGSERPEHLPARSPLTWAAPGTPGGPSPVLAIARILEAGRLQSMHHTGLKQKLGGPEAQGSSHKGYGRHPKGRPHKTPAARESALAETPGRGPGLRAGCPCHAPPHPGGTLAPQVLRILMASPTSPALPPPRVPSHWPFLPDLCGTSSPPPRWPQAKITFSRKLSPLPPPSSKCPPPAAWLRIKESWSRPRPTFQ